MHTKIGTTTSDGALSAMNFFQYFSAIWTPAKAWLFINSFLYIYIFFLSQTYSFCFLRLLKYCYIWISRFFYLFQFYCSAACFWSLLCHSSMAFNPICFQVLPYQSTNTTKQIQYFFPLHYFCRVHIYVHMYLAIGLSVVDKA